MTSNSKILTLNRPIIRGQNKIGYIYLPEFYADFERPNGPRCAADVAKEVGKAESRACGWYHSRPAVIMEAVLSDVVQMAGLFIEDGPICQVKGRDEKRIS